MIKQLRNIYFLIAVVFLLDGSIAYGQNKVLKKISESFNIDNRDKLDSIAKQLNYKSGDQIKVLTIFTIDEEGNVVDIKARSVHPLFEKEAIRVLSELPKMPPVKYNGKAISQKYSMPIIFEIESDRAKKQRLKKKKHKRKRDLIESVSKESCEKLTELGNDKLSTDSFNQIVSSTSAKYAEKTMKVYEMSFEESVDEFLKDLMSHLLSDCELVKEFAKSQ